VATAYINLLEAPSAETHSRLLNAVMSSMVFQRKKIQLGREACAEEGFTVMIEAINSHDISNACYNANESTLICGVCHQEKVVARETGLEIHMKTPLVFSDQQDFCDWIHVHEDDATDFRCNPCGANRNGKRRDTLVSLNKIVVCCFDAPYADRPKWFPQLLKFPGTLPGSFLQYELVAKIERVGVTPTAAMALTQLAGHTWAHVRRNGKWFKADDGHISEGSGLPSEATFMIFYVTVRDRGVNPTRPHCLGPLAVCGKSSFLLSDYN